MLTRGRNSGPQSSTGQEGGNNGDELHRCKCDECLREMSCYGCELFITFKYIDLGTLLMAYILHTINR